MTRAIDDTLSEFLEELQHEAVDGPAAGSDHGRQDAKVLEHPVASRRSDQQRIRFYGRLATAAIVLLLVATGVSYFLYRAEREAMTSRVDAIVRAPLETPLEQRLLALEEKFVHASSANEVRLQTIEQRLAANEHSYQQQLQDVGQRLEQMHKPHERRLQRVEQRLARLTPADGKRVQAIENRLVQITARMDGWAAVVADLSNEGKSGVAVNAATAPEPPATHPVEPPVVARNNVVLQYPQSLPAATQDRPQRSPGRPATQGDQGGWVINIGSYLYKGTAARKQAEFERQGVTTELVTATVRGKAMYRLQVPGFESMAAASGHASQVQEALGLEETWIRRR